MIVAAADVLSQSLTMDGVYALRITAAVVLGGVIGLERELRDKPAGFRTIVLISVGACVFTILSQAVGGPDMNNTRIAAQIVTGIGFLGAGAILHDRTNVVGLTTAATIWAVAAIGMATGFGRLSLALLGTGAILVVLLLFDVVERWIGDRRDIQDYYISAGRTEDSLKRVDDMFAAARLHTRKRVWHEEGSSIVFHVRAMGAKSNHEQLRMKLTRSDEYELRRA